MKKRVVKIVKQIMYLTLVLALIMTTMPVQTYVYAREEVQQDSSDNDDGVSGQDDNSDDNDGDDNDSSDNQDADDNDSSDNQDADDNDSSDNQDADDNDSSDNQGAYGRCCRSGCRRRGQSRPSSGHRNLSARQQ